MQREFDKMLLRSSLIDEYHLDRDVREEQRLFREAPESWQQVEASRRRRNDELAPLNARLRSLGLDPVPASLSLEEREQELQRLRESNAAAIAVFRSES